MNESLRKQVNKFIAENGIIAKYIAKQISISSTLLSLFRHGKKNLGTGNAEKLKQFISKYSIKGGVKI